MASSQSSSQRMLTSRRLSSSQTIFLGVVRSPRGCGLSFFLVRGEEQFFREDRIKTDRTNKTNRIKTVRTDKTIRTFVRDRLNRLKVLRSQGPNNPKTSKTDKTSRIKTSRTDKTIRIFVRDRLNRLKVLRSQGPNRPNRPNRPQLSPSLFALSENFTIFVRFMCARIHLRIRKHRIKQL